MPRAPTRPQQRPRERANGRRPGHIRASEVPPGAATSPPTPGPPGPQDPGRWRAAGKARWQALLRVAVGPEGRLLGSREAEAAHAWVGEAPAARPRRRDGEAHAAVRQPAAVALVQPRELPSGVEVPDLGHGGPAPPARRVRFRQRQPPGHEEHVACEEARVTTRQAEGSPGPRQAYGGQGEGSLAGAVTEGTTRRLDREAGTPPAARISLRARFSRSAPRPSTSRRRGLSSPPRRPPATPRPHVRSSK